MSKRTSIYLSPPLNELLEAHLAKDEQSLRSASALLATAVDRYLEIVRRNVPDWTVEQWSLACDALNGVWTDGTPQMAIQSVQASILDGAQLDGLAAKWDVDMALFAPKLDSLTLTQAIAVLEVVERFWSDVRIGVKGIEALVQSTRRRTSMWSGEGSDAGRSLSARGE